MEPTAGIHGDWEQAMSRVMDAARHIPAAVSAWDLPAGLPDDSGSSCPDTLLPAQWEALYFSNAGEDLLRRLYSYQFRWLIRALETLRQETGSPGPLQERTLALIQVLLNGYVFYLEDNLRLPAAALTGWLEAAGPDLRAIRSALQALGTQHRLSVMLNRYLDIFCDFSCEHIFRIRDFRYADRLITQLSEAVADQPPTELEAILQDILIRCNFNHLSFLGYCRARYEVWLNGQRSRQEGLRKALEGLLIYPAKQDFAYDERWPPVREHLQGWLQQLSVQVIHEPQPVSKIRMNLSVAHFSCLLRALYDAEVFKGESLAGIFRMVTGNLSAKKQASISITSLKKEYYTVDQFTAARVRDLLQQMIGQINRHYFPVLAVISVMLVAAPGNH